jgi:hypothetical protein
MYAPATGGYPKKIKKDRKTSAGSAEGATARPGRTSYSTALKASKIQASMGWEGPAECQGLIVQPTVGAKAAQVPRAFVVGRVMDDGVDKEETQAGRLDRWIP